MEAVEKVGVDVIEAEALALEQLGLPRDKVIIEVLEEPKKGLLGVGARLAKVRVTPIEQARPGSVDLRKKPKKSSPQARENFAGREGRGDRGRGGRERHEGERRPRRDGYREDRGRPVEIKQDPRKKPHEEGEIFEAAKRIFERLKLELEFESKIIEEEKTLFFEVRGADAKHLIGREGKTLEAFQTIMAPLAAKDDDIDRIVVDVENYKAKKAAKAVAMAKRKISKVKRLGEAEKLDSMRAYERKAIHEALKDEEGIVTRSEGKPPHRHIVIDIEKIAEAPEATEATPSEQEGLD
jgi:spoIIIJ-associated protein